MERFAQGKLKEERQKSGSDSAFPIAKRKSATKGKVAV